MAEGNEQAVEQVMHVVADLPCVGCGYNLRMAAVGGRCTECGEGVGKSLEETALRWGGRYFRRVGRCVFWAAVLGIAMPVEFIGGMLLSRLLFEYYMRRGPGGMGGGMPDFQLMEFIEFGVMVVFEMMAGAYVLAVWMAAKGPKGVRVRGRGWLMRVGAGMFLMAVTLLFVQSALGFIEFGRFVPQVVADGAQAMRRFMQYVVYVFPALMIGLSLVANQASVRMADVERRCGNGAGGGFRKWSLRLFAWGWVMLMSVMLLMLIIERFGYSVMGSVEVFTVPVAIGGAVLSGAGLIMSVIALIRFSGRMKKVAKMAEAAGGVFTGVGIKEGTAQSDNVSGT